MKRSFRVGRIAFHPSTLAVFAGLLGAGVGFLLNVAAGGDSSQLLWIALVFAMLVSLALSAWQGYSQERSGQQWMAMLQEMVFQTYFLTVLADRPEVSQIAQQRLGQVLKTLDGDQQLSMLKFFSANGLPTRYIGDALQASGALAGADLQCMELPGIHLEGANLTRVNLSRANLSDAVLVGATLQHADLSGADLRRSRLNGAFLQGIIVRGADLTGADLSDAFIGTDGARAPGDGGASTLRSQRPADLSNAVLVDAKLRAATLTGADLNGAKLHGADLAKANLSGANLQGADLTDADLTAARLAGANLRQADLAGATLTWATLDDADLRMASVTEEQLRAPGSARRVKRSP